MSMKYAALIIVIAVFIYLGNCLITATARSRRRVLDHTRPTEPEKRQIVRMAYESRDPSHQVAVNLQKLSEKRNDMTLFSYEASASEVRQMLFDEQADVIIINGEKPKWLKEVVCRRIKTEHGMKNVTILWRKYRGKDKKKMKALVEIINEGNLYEQEKTG
ncbi:MAG: hypothetical protein IJO55_03960 [Lachnospiraceae bacterium]|nr:hypothetical protein [Lachnospiraceae bacterium]